MATATLQIPRMAQSQLTALRRIAQRDGMTTEEYVKQLIQRDLELDAEVQSKSFFELAAPLTEALMGKSEEELDAMVKAGERGRVLVSQILTFSRKSTNEKKMVDVADLTDEEMTDLLKLTRRCQNALTKVMKPDGFNIGINLGQAAGAGIASHLHIHVVPRWSGDTNFMPVLAQTTVLPEALTEVAAKLRAALAA